MKVSLKSYFVTGLIILVPTALTFWITFSLLLWLDEMFVFEKWLGVSIPGLGLVLAVGLILIAGILGRNVLGTWFIDQLSLLVSRIPFVGGIHGSLSQIMNTLANQGGDNLGRPVMVEFPRQGSWTIGFMTTNQPPPSLKKHFDARMVCVFVPTTPNPTSGFFFLAAEDNVKYLDIPVDEAFKIVVSLGLASKDKKPNELTVQSL